MRSTGLLLLSLVFIFSPLLAIAQVNPQNTEGGVQISVTPEYPRAGEAVHLTAASSLLVLSRSTVTWTAAGKVIASGIGATGANVVAGSAGSLLEIHVSAVSEDGARASGSARIRPVEIDLLWEAHTYTPPFYKGRALPSSGGSVHLYAIPRFFRPNGAMVPETQIDYTWRKNETLVSSVSGRGKSTAIFPAPTLHGTDTISVEAVSTDGIFEGKAEARIASREPVLNLYESHPIFGTLFHQAFGGQNQAASAETTFVAMPYFAAATRANDPRLVYRWQVNGNRVPADSTYPHQITINATNSDGVALIEAVLTQTNNWLVDSRGAWGISFSGSTQQNDPFRLETQ